MTERNPLVTLKGIGKTYAGEIRALRDIQMSVERGEFVAIVGPSGCGKSTLLRIIAGLSAPTKGRIEVHESKKTFIFQDPNLLPWRTVMGNAELILELEGVREEARRRQARAALALVGLQDFHQAYPRQLSGGMKMRVSLARALASQARLLLMDEPFAAVDEITRHSLNDELQQLWLTDEFTGLFVTHNLYEAVYLAHRVLVMSSRPGRIVADVEVSFPYPRSPDLRTDRAFADVAREVSAQLRRSWQVSLEEARP